MKLYDLNDMVLGYIECALWVAERDGEDISDEEKERARCECKAFLYRALPWLDAWTPSQCGHDFYLTRNHHGAGFWDRQQQYGDVLTDIAHSFGEHDVVERREEA